MDADTLIAIGQLWPLVLCFALVLAIVLFRKQLAKFFERLTRVKVSSTGAEFQANDKIGHRETDATVNQQIQKESVSDVDDGSVEESSTTDNAYLTMLRAFVDSDFTTAKQAYEKKRAEVQSEDKRRELEAHYLSLCYIRAVDSGALDKLRALSSYKSTKVNVLRWLAYCYWSTKDYSKAREIYIEARDSADEVNAAQLTVSIAECWEKEGNPDQGIEEIIIKLREVEQADAKLYLYKSMASMYQAKGSERMRAIALEKALEFAPNDKGIRFSAAYAQSQAKLSAVSITNYDTLWLWCMNRYFFGCSVE